MGADVNKPNGQFRLGPTRPEVLDFLRHTPTRKVPGVGRVGEKTVAAALGAQTCGELLESTARAQLIFSSVRASVTFLLHGGDTTAKLHGCYTSVTSRLNGA